MRSDNVVLRKPPECKAPNIARKLTDKMRMLTALLFFLFVTTTSFSQDVANDAYGMTAEENEIWLKKALSSDKETQLTLIKNRFFRQEEFKKSANDAIPIVVINGIIVSEVSNVKLKNVLVNQLTPDKVMVTIIEKEPERIYINKAWTGIILLTISDKKINKLLKKQKP